MKNAGVFMGGSILLYAVIMLWQSFSLDYYTSLGPGPGFFPLWLSIVLIILSLIYLWESIKKEILLFSKILPKGRALHNILVVLGSVLVFMILVNFTGFIIASSILLFLVLMREFKWYQGAGIAVFSSVLLFYVFKTLLDVPLPVNAFGW